MKRFHILEIEAMYISNVNWKERYRTMFYLARAEPEILEYWNMFGVIT